MTRRCSHCGHNGHNSRTCPERGVRIFGVRISDNSKMRKSVSTGNLSNYSGAAQVQPTPDHSDNANGSQEGYVSDGQNPTAGRERKKGVPWTEEEHRLFLLGLQKLGKGDWRGISRNYVQTRTPTQVASHAQKYFIRQSNLNKRKRRSSLFDIGTEGGTGGMNRSMSTPSLATLSEEGHGPQSPQPSGRPSNFTPIQPYNMDKSSSYSVLPGNSGLTGSIYSSASDLQRSIPFMYGIPHVGSSSSLESLGEKQGLDFPSLGYGSGRLPMGLGSGMIPNRSGNVGMSWQMDRHGEGMGRVPSTQSLKIDESAEGTVLHTDYNSFQKEDHWLVPKPLVTRKFLTDAPIFEREEGPSLPALKEESEKGQEQMLGRFREWKGVRAQDGNLHSVGFAEGKGSGREDLTGMSDPGKPILDNSHLNLNQETTEANLRPLHSVVSFNASQIPWNPYSHYPGYPAIPSGFSPYGVPPFPWNPYIPGGLPPYGLVGSQLTPAKHDGSPKLYRPTATLPAFIPRRDEREVVFGPKDTLKEFTDESKGAQSDEGPKGPSGPSPLTLQLLESPSLRQSAFQSHPGGQTTAAAPPNNGNSSPRSSDVSHSPISVV